MPLLRRAAASFLTLSVLLTLTAGYLWVRSYSYWEGLLTPQNEKGRTASFYSNMGRVHVGLITGVEGDPLNQSPRRRTWQYIRPAPGARPIPLRPADEPLPPGLREWTFAGVMLRTTTPIKTPEGYSPAASSVQFSLPWSYLCALFATPALLWLARAFRQPRRRRTGTCPTCGYDLRVTPERCPECGTTTTPSSAV
jgi:hypothetical protein